MLKLFRKIRQKFVSESKFSKYLLYALGEIILVVIGILIALQLNNAKEQRSSDRIEISYLNGILNNLNQDIYELNELIELDTLQFEAYSLLLQAFTDKSINRKSPTFIKSIGKAYLTHGYSGNSIVFEDMKSSGKLNFIKSDALRFSILDYYNESKKLSEVYRNSNTHVISGLKNEAFPDYIDMNSLIEKFIVPDKWKSEIDDLDLSFFDSDIDSPEVRQFANRISIFKAYLLNSFRSNDLLSVKAEGLKANITNYLDNVVVDEESYLSKELLTAIKNGNVNDIKNLVSSSGINKCYTTKFDKSNLIVISIFENSLESLKYFVENGADLESICANKTPLMYAAKYDRLEMLKYLIESGADLNTVSIKGKTALSYSIEYKNPRIENHLHSIGVE